MDAIITSESVQKAYKRYASFYDFVFGAVFHPGRKTAIEHLQCADGDRILEVGVGTGLSLNMYSEKVKVVGIDLSAEMLEKAKNKVQLENLTQVEDLQQMDAQAMTFADNSFDKVIAMYVASVVPDVTELAKEIERVCKPGGKIIYLNHFENSNPLIRKAEVLIQPLAEYLGFHPEFPMQEFLQKTGFKVDQKIPVNMLDYWTVLVGINRKGTGTKSKASKQPAAPKKPAVSKKSAASKKAAAAKEPVTLSKKTGRKKASKDRSTSAVNAKSARSKK